VGVIDKRVDKMITRLKNGLAVLLVFLLALWIRVLYIENTIVDTPIRADAFSYVTYGHNLVTHGVFSKQQSDHPVSDSYWSPGFPTFIAFAIKLGGENFYKFILYGHALMGAVVCGVTVLLGIMFLPLWASVTAGLLAAFSPHLISMGGYVLTETLFSLVLLLSLYGFCLAVRKSRVNWFALAGLGFGLTYLVNPVVLFAPVVIGLSWWWVERWYRNNSAIFSLRMLAIFWLPFVLVVATWSLRNHFNVPDGELSSSDRALTNFVVGSHDNFFEIWRNNPRDPQNPATLDQATIRGSWVKFIEILSTRIYENPAHYLKWYFIEKPYLLFSWNILIGSGDIYVYPVIISLYQQSKWMILTYSIMKVLHWWLLLFGLLGLIYIFLSKKLNDSDYMAIFIYSLIFSISAIYVILQAEPRYSIPLRPELYLCAVFFIAKTWHLLRLISADLNRSSVGAQVP